MAPAPHRHASTHPLEAHAHQAGSRSRCRKARVASPRTGLRNADVTADRQRRRARSEPLVYRPVGNPGERYPDWLHAVKDASGVYVIRQRYHDGTAEVCYVGESHTDALYKTVTRHFQRWQRWKQWWRGQYGEGHDPGLTYERGSVDVAIRVTAPDDAIDEEGRLIRRLRPRDNLRGQHDLQDAPF